MKKAITTIPIVTISGKEFSEAFRIVATGADAKGHRLIDKHALITTDAEAGTIVLRTVQTGYSFKYTIRNQAVQSNDSFTLDIGDMSKRLSALRDTVSIIRVGDETIKFEIGSLSFAMTSLDPDDFYSDRSLDMKPTHSFSGEEFARYLRLVLSTIDPRHYLPFGGVSIRSEGNDRLILTGVSQYEGCTRCEVPVLLNSEEPIDIIIPKPMATTILIGLSLAKEGQAVVEIMQEPKGDQFGVRIANTIITGRLISGEFPEIGAMFTQEVVTTCKVPRDEFGHALSVIFLSWNRKDAPSRTALRFGRNKLLAFNPAEPDTQATFDIGLSGPVAQIEVNTKQIRTTVANLRGNEVCLSIAKNGSVLVTDPSDPKYTHVAAPFNNTLQAPDENEELNVDDYAEAA